MKAISGASSASQANSMTQGFTTMSAAKQHDIYAVPSGNPYVNKGSSMPNTVHHSNTNSPNNKSILHSQTLMKGNYMNSNHPSKGNSRTSANSIQNSPNKHMKNVNMQGV